MLLKTKNFGEIEINEENQFTFEEGLPGFESMRRFALVSNPEEDSPFCWLQSVEDPELAFVMINPLYFRSDYSVEIDDATVKSLQIERKEDVALYSIVVVPEDVSKISANLKAPLLLNTRNRKGRQVILDTNEYHVRHYILEEFQKQGA